MFERIDPRDSESTERFRRMAAPQIDQMVRQAISTCWMILPAESQRRAFFSKIFSTAT